MWLARVKFGGSPVDCRVSYVHFCTAGCAEGLPSCICQSFLFFVSSLWSVEWAVFSKKEVTTKLSGKIFSLQTSTSGHSWKSYQSKSELSDLPSVEALLSQLVGFSCCLFHLVCWGEAKIGLYLRYFSQISLHLFLPGFPRSDFFWLNLLNWWLYYIKGLLQSRSKLLPL